jgi:hypothetical protein
MKKSILALAAVAAGVAFGSNCSPDPDPCKDNAWVYQWKFTGKTTAGKVAAAKASACAAGEDCTYRVKSSLKIQGYTYACGCDCGTEGFEAFDEALEVFWMAKPWKTYLTGGVSTEVSHIIGKKKKQYEAFGVAEFNDPVAGSTLVLSYAGLGKYKKGRVSSVSGNFAGAVSVGYAYNVKKDICINTGYWDCNTLALVGCGEPTVAFGKWSAKFKKSASKKYGKSGKTAKIPNYAVAWPNAL